MMKTTSTTIEISSVEFIERNSVAKFTGKDGDGVKWEFKLAVSNGYGAAFWLAHTAYSGMNTLLTSYYSGDADEWFARCGNYSVHSRSFYGWEQVG